jgi:hypothetical protein
MVGGNVISLASRMAAAARSCFGDFTAEIVESIIRLRSLSNDRQRILKIANDRLSVIFVVKLRAPEWIGQCRQCAVGPSVVQGRRVALAAMRAESSEACGKLSGASRSRATRGEAL